METGVYRQRFLSPSTKHWVIGLLLILIGWGSGCTLLVQPPTTEAAGVEAEEVRLIVQVQYPTVDVLNALAGELDVWEVDRTAQTFIARVTQAQYDMLLQQALIVTLDCAKMAQYGEPRGAVTPAIAVQLAEQCPAEK